MLWRTASGPLRTLHRSGGRSLSVGTQAARDGVMSRALRRTTRRVASNAEVARALREMALFLEMDAVAFSA